MALPGGELLCLRDRLYWPMLLFFRFTTEEIARECGDGRSSTVSLRRQLAHRVGGGHLFCNGYSTLADGG